MHMEGAPQLAKERRARACSAHCMLRSLPGACGPAGQERRPGACLRCGHPSCRPRHAHRARAQSAQQARLSWWCPLLLWACLQQVQSAWLESSRFDAPQPIYLPVCIGKALAQTLDSHAHIIEREVWWMRSCPECTSFVVAANWAAPVLVVPVSPAPCLCSVDTAAAPAHKAEGSNQKRVSHFKHVGVLLHLSGARLCWHQRKHSGVQCGTDAGASVHERGTKGFGGVRVRVRVRVREQQREHS